MGSRETQDRIKSAAVELFNKHGTGRVSTNRIADACGISKGNLHYHFHNKQEILRAIYDDITREIDSNWHDDDKQPTVVHMAEMFARQLNLIWRYRFLYREMVSLARADEELGKTIRESREKRIDALVHFFETLVDVGVLKKPRSKESLRYLVLMTWIFSDNWLNFVELQYADKTDEVVQLGYDFIIEILYPYLTDTAKSEVYESYRAINELKKDKS